MAAHTRPNAKLTPPQPEVGTLSLAEPLVAPRPARRAPSKRTVAPLPPLDNRVTFIAHRINARLAQVCNPLFRRHDIDLVSSRMLVVLLERKEVRVGELVEIMVLPQSTISHQLQRLERRGLIRRRRTLTDNRSVAVTLTAQGSKMAKECNALSAAVYHVIISSFAPAELDMLRELLCKMFLSLQDFETADI